MMSSKSESPLHRIGLRICVIYGFALLAAILLIYTGLVHLGNTYGFLASILRFRLTGFELSKVLAIVLPFAHILVGVCLLTRFFFHESLIFTASMFTTYTFAQFSVMLRGMTIDCGCYGFDSHVISWFSAVQVCLLASGGWVAAFFNAKSGKRNVVK
ncbi:MAG TPA: MauE/DoxX family redox-associated membrane protein [Pirellulaceae bacterium]|nr:MauE/DoxX family redox-associated membrane protein [Pirellulaceae bacterium]HMO93310.1 MauE/DoxX family redox-associated membrane protein [Pirellulaceae bacterium]HMP69151.1 MauE/DoxX family redox-associated membrane protein [Pirellulaceae bacterium]